MASYEYEVLTFRWGIHRQHSCEGIAVLGGDDAEARGKLRAALAPTIPDRQAERRRAHEQAVSEFEAALAEWTTKKEAIAATYHVVTFEEPLRKRSRQVVKKERVTMPGGGTRDFNNGAGAAYVRNAIKEAVGTAPTAPPAFDEMSDAALLNRLLDTAEVEEVGRWRATSQPEDGALDAEPFTAPRQSRVVAELNRLGAEGWRLVTVSEDRTISASNKGTSTSIVAETFTLMREKP